MRINWNNENNRIRNILKSYGSLLQAVLNRPNRLNRPSVVSEI